MRVLGIDPGTIRCGYTVLDSGPRYVEAGVVEAPAREIRSRRLITIGRDLRDVLGEFRPDAIAVETAKWGGHASAAGALGEIRGVILWLAAEAAIPVTDYAPSEARRLLGVGGRAAKTNVARVVQRALGLRVSLRPDAADAAAIALVRLMAG